MSKINLLITGSSGFIGSNLIRYLLKNFSEYKISSIDSIKNIKSTNTIYFNKSHDFYMGDITDTQFVRNVFEISRPDIIIHCAEENDISNTTDIINTNILGTQILIDYALKYNVNKFVLTSTGKVYGSLKDENEPSHTENSPINPTDIYSSSKASAELLLKVANNSHELKYNIVRLSNNYGPRQSKNHLIPKIITNIIENKEVIIFNKGLEVNDWSFVQNTCSAIKAIVEKGDDNEIYNISSGAEFSNIEVFNEICNIMGKGHDLLKFVTKELNGFRYSICADKLKNLGSKSEYKFKGIDGSISFNIDWVKNNHSYYK